jgi:hypothetical protein
MFYESERSEYQIFKLQLKIPTSVCIQKKNFDIKNVVRQRDKM